MPETDDEHFLPCRFGGNGATAPQSTEKRRRVPRSNGITRGVATPKFLISSRDLGLGDTHLQLWDGNLYFAAKF